MAPVIDRTPRDLDPDRLRVAVRLQLGLAPRSKLTTAIDWAALFGYLFDKGAIMRKVVRDRQGRVKRVYALETLNARIDLEGAGRIVRFGDRSIVGRLSAWWARVRAGLQAALGSR